MIHTAANTATLQFLLYFHPVEVDGHVMCPRCEHCKANCLVASGRARCFSTDGYNRLIDTKRKRSELFLYNRDLFMKILIREINNARAKAARDGMDFMIRLNGTSDISPLHFSTMARIFLKCTLMCNSVNTRKCISI